MISIFFDIDIDIDIDRYIDSNLGGTPVFCLHYYTITVYKNVPSDRESDAD